MRATRLSVIRLPVLMYCLFPRKSAKARMLLSVTFRKPFGPAVLNIRPPGLAKACHVKGLSSAQIFFFVASKALRRITQLLHSRGLPAAAISFLYRFDYRGEN